MATQTVDLEKIAEAAAQGVAIALAARSTIRTRRPLKIICGIPPDIFSATLERDRSGRYVVGKLQPERLGREAPRGS